MSDIHSPIHYRPEIDGLRAFAVLAVILFHAFPSLLAGGFIGVDIFFVISGYLISKIILKETALGKFTFISFYQRRIRRIYPALILVVAVTAIIGWFSLFPDELVQLFKHISLTTLFIANFGFWQEAGYFDNTAETKPLLHFWSLGVEEQFYIVWPLLLLFFLRKFPAKFGASLVVFSVLSFICNIALLAEQKEAAFFLPFGRWWELAAGGVLASAETNNAYPARYLVHKYNINLKGVSIEDLMSASGFILITASALTFREHFDFPGFWALLPVSGSLLIIVAGQGSRINRFLLSNKIAVSIGLISYPLYLWHWPIFSYLHILKLASVETLCAGIALTFILATATYHLIEKPIRTRPASRYSAALLLASAICLAIGILGWQGILKPRLNFP